MARIYFSNIHLVLAVSAFYFVVNVFVDAAAPRVRSFDPLLSAPAAALILIFAYLDLALKARLFRAAGGAPAASLARLFSLSLVSHLALLTLFYWGPHYLMALAASPLLPGLSVHEILRLPMFAARHVPLLAAHTVIASFLFALLVSGSGAGNKNARPAALVAASLRLAFSGAAVPLVLPAVLLNAAKFLFYTVLDHSVFGDSASRLAGINIMQFVSPAVSFYIFLIAASRLPGRGGKSTNTPALPAR